MLVPTLRTCEFDELAHTLREPVPSGKTADGALTGLKTTVVET
jgi:hypothetical protein